VAAVSLTHLVRPAAGKPEGLLVLFHGRGADERDLFPLLDVLDPERRLLGVTPRGPLHLPPGGAHWYAVREIGYPDPATFAETFALASSWLDALSADADISAERTVLGGFSQGAVMTYALGLGEGRPRPAGLIALSGFMPTVPGFDLDLDPPLPRIAIGHGAIDAVISVDWSRDARTRLTAAGADLTYRESPQMGHSIDPAFFRELPAWLADTMGFGA
jgi:phospholipase/carboxylesterase